MTIETTALVFLDEDTGEMVEPDRSAADLTMAALMDYAKAKVGLDVARSDRAHRIAELEQTDTVLAAIAAQEMRHAVVVEDMEDALADVFSAEIRMRSMRPISLDIGAVRITWGKPAERWTQRVKPQAIAARDPEMAKALGIECKVGDPPAPRITVRPPAEAR